jgi:hypothetical protein
MQNDFEFNLKNKYEKILLKYFGKAVDIWTSPIYNNQVGRQKRLAYMGS